jgi:dipeptidyl aminopeptidase/acylaminoacyl peptidase
VARKSNLLAAASIASVLLEPSYYWLNGVAGRDIHDGLRQAWKLGSPDETPERWKQVSPALSIEEFKTPLLMQYSEQEFRPTIEFFARLSNSSTPVDLYVFPQERHVLSQPRHRLAAYERNLDWFRFWLQGYVDQSPDKAEQYRRWQAMAKARGETGP